MSRSQLQIKHRFEEQKANFLKRLGAKSDKDLYKNILKESFEGDAFEDNIEALFANYYSQKGKSCERFYDSFLLWGEEKLDEAFKLRWKVAGINTLGLFGAFGLSFANPIAGIAAGVAVSVTAGVAEGVAKRNVANFGHLQSHLYHKIHACATRMIEKALKLDCLTPQAKQKLQDLEHPENKSKKSALTRFSSYFSGPIASGVNNLVSRFSGISTLASGVIGTFIPFLPLATVGLSRIASNIRHKSAISEGQFLDDVAEIIFDENSWSDKQRSGAEIEKLSQEFSQELAASDNHGRIPSDKKKYHKGASQSKDKNTNIKKGITFLPWLSAKFHKFIKRKLLKKDVEDIAEASLDEIIYLDEDLAWQEERKSNSNHDHFTTPILEQEKILEENLLITKSDKNLFISPATSISQPNVVRASLHKSIDQNLSQTIWQTSGRENKFRTIGVNYRNEEEIADVIIAVIHSLTAQIKKSNPAFAIKDAIETTEYARLHGGVSNLYNQDTDKYSKNSDTLIDLDKIKFSSLAQKEFEKIGLFTDRQENAKMVGMRLTRIPSYVIERLKKENEEGLEIDETKNQKLLNRKRNEFKGSLENKVIEEFKR